MLLLILGTPSHIFSMADTKDVKTTTRANNAEIVIPSSFLQKISALYRDDKSCPQYRTVMTLTLKSGSDYAKHITNHAIECGDNKLFSIALGEIKT